MSDAPAEIPLLIPFATLPWRDLMLGVRDKRVELRGQILRLVEYTPEMPPHDCERGHVGMIIEGELEVALPSQTLLFRAGDGVHLPAGPEHRHRARALSNVVQALFVESP